MSTVDAKLGYIASQHRVKLELTRQICLQKDGPDPDLFQRAAAKLESVKKSGAITSFQVFEESVRKVWKKLREETGIPETQVISMTLGQGAPKLVGFDFSPSTNPKAIIDITISATPREIAKWYHGWIIYTLNREIARLGSSEQVNGSQVKGAMMRAITGQPVVSLPISGVQAEGNPSDADKAYSIVANRARKEISFVVRDVRGLLKKVNEASLIKLVAVAAAKMKEQTGDEYKVLEDEISTNYKAIANGPELLGIDTPAVILGAIGIESIASTAPSEAKANLGLPKDQHLEIKVTDNKLIASVANFSMDLYDDPTISFDKAWFRLQLKKYRIPEKLSSQNIDNMVQAAQKQIDLTGMFVAQGRAAVDGAGPYIYESYRDAGSRHIDVENDVLDIRGLQQRSLVAAGDLIAEIKYKEEAKNGYDVFGDAILPNPPAEIDVQVGEGVQRKDGGKFYAMYEGVPVIEKNCISLSKILIHKGDVNLRTGDIVFDGPVEIQGSIDTGASITATGDVTIIGSVRGGKIKAGGSITVTGGVVTGTSGSLEAKGNIMAEFIENSRVHCEGTLAAKRSILNCDVITGANIEIVGQPDGILAGGSLSCKQDISAPNIGFKRGAMTILRVGVDWRIERTVKIKSGRLKKVTECQERDRLELRELVGKSRAQMTKKHDDKKKELQSRLTKAREIVGKLQAQLDHYKAKLSFNMTSSVFVENILCNNVEIHIGGSKISVPNDLAGIAVVAKKRRGSHIVPVDEARKSAEAQSEAG